MIMERQQKGVKSRMSIEVGSDSEITVRWKSDKCVEGGGVLLQLI